MILMNVLSNFFIVRGKNQALMMVFETHFKNGI